MSNISKEKIETKILELIAREELSLEQLSLDDLIPEEEKDQTDLKSLFIELGTIKTEFKQMNRIEKNRLDTMKAYFDEERRSKQELLENLNTLPAEVAYSKQKVIFLSILEIKDFIESFNEGLPLVFNKNNTISFLLQKLSAKQAFDYVETNVNMTIKKIDQLLDKANVYPILSDCVTFDPATMIAVEALNDPNSPDLKVMETVEKGYYHHNKVIRLAKVKVNKTETTVKIISA